MSDAIGIMDGAFFVSKKELLSWLNGLLGLNYTKVEQVCNGAAFCQIMDAIYPGKVPLHKVNFGAKLPHEMIANYKVLQAVFDKCGMGKVIDVDRLIQGKAMDNLEFLQWFHRYFELNNPGGDYNGAERRKAAGAADTSVVAAPQQQKPKATAAAPAAAPPPSTVKKVTPPGTTVKPTKATAEPRQLATKAPAAKARAAAAPKHTTTEATAPEEGNGAVPEDRADISVAELGKLKYTVEMLERERDFYFSKLRSVEDICQDTIKEKEKNPPALNAHVERVLEVLYKKDEGEQH